MIPMQEPVTEFKLEAPAGLIGIHAECRNGKVTQVTFENVPAFSVHRDAVLDVPELGKVIVDVAWGGMFYVIADMTQFDALDLVPERGRDITRVGALILRAAQDQLPVEHPDYPGIGITIAQLSGPTTNPNADRRNAVLVASGPIDFDNPATWTGGIDRCPCGTGTCAKMASLYDKGELALNQPFRHEGILGQIYIGELIKEVTIGGRVGVVPTLSGQAWITGYSTCPRRGRSVPRRVHGRGHLGSARQSGARRQQLAVAPRTSPHPTGRFSAQSHECGSKGP